MKYFSCIAMLTLVTGCITSSGSSRRPLSDCARRLVERGYLTESETALADDYCRTRSPEQLAAARAAVDADKRISFVEAIEGGPSETPPAPAPLVVRPSSVVTVVTTPEPEPVAVAVTPAPAQPFVESLDVLAIVSSDPDLSTFVALLHESGLADDLQAAKAVTLFAPTNAAFEKMPRLAANKVRLKQVLSVHIVMDEVTCSDAPEAPAQPKRVMTLGGKKFPVRATADGVVIGRAKVVRADLAASNGNVDIVDAVLLP